MVGHDLSRGTSMFKKTERPQTYEEPDIGDLIETVERPEPESDARDDSEPAAEAETEARLALA